jgi:hypothetical protein
MEDSDIQVADKAREALGWIDMEASRNVRIGAKAAGIQPLK